MSGSGHPGIAAGEIIFYRLFDIAYAIDLRRAEAVLARRPAAAARRKRLSATPPKAVSFDSPPVVLGLDPVRLPLDDTTQEASVAGHLYDFGVLSLALSVPVRDLPWASFVDRVNALAAALGDPASDALWSSLVARVRAELAEALVRPSETPLQEDYTVALVRAFDRPMTAARIAADIDLVPLLSGERLPLADDARAELLRARFSYYVDDYAVLTWDRAFVYEPHPDTDVIDVLEVANAQLLEMRYYDELLDDELPRMYALVEQTQRSGLLSSRRFAKLARRLYTLVAEVTELTERVDNALHVTEDVYLARVYAGAVDLLRVKLFSTAVERKLAIIRDTYAALYDEAGARRAEVLELAIVALILIEIVIALWR